jgi:hypothetical protein
VIVGSTAGEVSARCHDEEANSFALNLLHDIVTGARTADEAGDCYAKEFLDYRRKMPTPYMEGLRSDTSRGTADKDQRVFSDHDLELAKRRSGGLDHRDWSERTQTPTSDGSRVPVTTSAQSEASRSAST